MDIDLRKIETPVAIIHSKIVAMDQCKWVWHICRNRGNGRSPKMELIEISYRDALRYIRENGLIQEMAAEDGEVYDDAEKSFRKLFRHYYRSGGREHINREIHVKYFSDDENQQ